MNVITADIGRSLVPVSLQVPKDSDSDDDDDGDNDNVVVQEIGSDIDDRRDLAKCMIKLKTKAKQLRRRGRRRRRRRRRGRRRALPHFYIQQDLVEFAGHERGEQALWIFHNGAGNFNVSI